MNWNPEPGDKPAGSEVIAGIACAGAVLFIIWIMWGSNWGQRHYERSKAEFFHVR